MGSDKGEEILKKIKDGCILEELTDYSDLKLGKTKKEVINTVIRFHKKTPPLFPKIDDLTEYVNLCEDYIRAICISLEKDDEILCRLSFSQIWKNFGYYESHKPKLPRSLDMATHGDLSNMRGYNFYKKMNRNSSASHWQNYYLALLKEADVCGRKVPLFQRIFDFEPKPISV